MPPLDFDETSPEDDDRVIEAVLARLGRRFDAIQVFASRSDGETTTCHQRGAGNVYARIAHAREWVIKQEERSRLEVRREVEAERDGDEGHD